MSRLRLVIADDSLFMRAAVKKIVAADARIEVVGEARDGQEAVDQVIALQPHVCTMDFNMPRLDGAQAVREIMRRRPTPVVMLSAHTREGARETFEALAAGAVDFLAKPSGEVSADFSRVGAALLHKLHAAATARPQQAPREAAAAAHTAPARITQPRSIAVAGLGGIVGGAGLGAGIGGVAASVPKIAVVAVSTGGPAALGQLLPRFPADTSLALVIVQHLPAGFTAALAERLDGLCAIRVREASDGDRPAAGLALIAPGDRHLEVAADGCLRVVDGPEVNGVRPAADVTMRAAAHVWGRRLVGVVMTGMGRDGADGLRAIKAAGGATVVQDEASSVVWGMPRACIEAGVADRVSPLDLLAEAIRLA